MLINPIIKNDRTTEPNITAIILYLKKITLLNKFKLKNAVRFIIESNKTVDEKCRKRYDSEGD
jgi:hypothetical protein